MSNTLQLTQDEKAILAGARGQGAARALEIVEALARIAGVDRLLPVRSAHVSGISYRNIGEAGLHFLKTLAAGVEGLAVPATMNPGGVDLRQWRALGGSKAFVDKQLEIVSVLEGMGVEAALTCAPYHVGNKPCQGDAVAWAESSAVSYANSVLGARTQREGGPAALAAAITGRTVGAGPHLTENRMPTLVVDVMAELRCPADAGALGFLAGSVAGGGVPYFRGNPPPVEERDAFLRALGAAMAASGAVALYHWEGITPEWKVASARLAGSEILAVRDLSPGFDIPGTRPKGHVDLVAFGCPHASLAEIRALAREMEPGELQVPLWVMTSRHVAALAEDEGLGESLRRAGARLVCDTCIVVAPLKDMGYSAVATDSGKAATYLPSHQNVPACFGDRRACLRAARTGEFVSGR